MTPGDRSSAWVKLKLQHQQDVVVGGYKPDGESSIDALVVGYYDDKGLRYAGKVRAGSSHARGVICVRD